MLSRYAEALGMYVDYFDPYVEGGVMNLFDLLRESDFVSLHMPLQDSTKGYISEAMLRQMKTTAYLINTARGELIQEGALLKALQEGIIAGAASDFYDDGLLEYSKSHDNLILTPHLGGATHEGLEKADALIASKLKDILHEQGQETKEKRTETGPSAGR